MTLSWLRWPVAVAASMSACTQARLGQGSAMAPASCAVVPGQDIQISNELERSGDRPAYMFEMQLAQNPTNPNNLVASGIHVRGAVKEDPDPRHQEVLLFVSDDRGKTWRKMPLPPFPLVDGKPVVSGDPTVFFSKRGTAVYLTLARGPYANLSSDGGRTWTAPARMIPNGFDHWMVAGDTTSGRFAGNLYAWGMRTKTLKPRAEADKVDYNFVQYEVRLLRSRDDGKTWTDELAATTTDMGIPGNGLNSVSDILIDPKGRIYLPFHSWNNLDRSKPRGQWLTISDDGGATFTKARQITKANGALLTGPMAGGYPAYALDATNGPHKNRLYIAWSDSTAASGRWQLLFSYSDDGGATFAEPKVIDDNMLKIDQVHPDMQVNKQGVLVLTWYRFQTEGPVAGSAAAGEHALLYNRYVTASVDGGQTFLATKPLGSRMSRSMGTLGEFGWGLKYVRFGDYFNIVADPDGSFHTIWMGGAGGPTQQWYAPFSVQCR